jgi:hypothetical protein
MLAHQLRFPLPNKVARRPGLQFVRNRSMAQVYLCTEISVTAPHTNWTNG